jgi:hypothetical protein
MNICYFKTVRKTPPPFPASPQLASRHKHASLCVVAALFSLVLCLAAQPVLAQPVINAIHPPALTERAGDHVAFTVSATGSGTLSYQWYQNGALLVNQTTPILSEAIGGWCGRHDAGENEWPFLRKLFSEGGGGYWREGLAGGRRVKGGFATEDFATRPGSCVLAGGASFTEGAGGCWLS